MDSSIRFNVSADTAQFQSGMRQVDATAKSTAAGIKQAFSGLGGLLAGGAVLGGLKTIMDDFDKVAKVATRFGASAEDIQRVSVAADLAGVSIDTVARVLTKMSVAASEASTGNEAMAEAFKRAGINAEQFKNAGLEEQLVMLSEAFNRARGDADATNQVIELMGTRAAGQMIPLIDNTAALREEMAGVAVASDRAVRQIEAANDVMTRFKNNVAVLGARLIEDFSLGVQQLTSFFSGSGLKTIDQLKEIELRAQAIKELTKESVFGFDADENARLIAERMEEIRKKINGVKETSALLNEDLDTANSLEKEKTSELERQQRLLEQQESKRKEAIKDAQFEVELIEAKLRGDKARVAALEEQRDFERALKQTGDFETAANVAATKAAERTAQDTPRQTAAAASAGGMVGMPQTALQQLQSQAETSARARAELMRLQNEQARGMNRAGDLREKGFFGSSARAEIQAERRAEQRAQRFMAQQIATDRFGGNNMGEAFRNFRNQMAEQGIFGSSQRDFQKWAMDQAKTEPERQAEAERSAAGGGGASSAPVPLATESTLQKLVQEVIDRLPQNALTT